MTDKMYNMTRAYIGIGTNLGNRLEYLRDACRALEHLGIVRCSSVYETSPVGYTDQPNFLNMVAELYTSLRPLQLLAHLSEVEAHHGRVRTVRYGPRTLDLDILLYNDEYICFRTLQVPHPRMWERAFVLVPLAELVPEHRGLGGLSLRFLAEQASAKGGIQRVGPIW